MAEYQLTAAEEPCSVIRDSDKACIPPDMANRDYNGDQFQPGYIQWKEAGGVPDPYVEPEPAEAQPTEEQRVLYEHENRLLSLEGLPPITPEDFAIKARGAEGKPASTKAKTKGK
jgi:hypothetical protein